MTAVLRRVYYGDMAVAIKNEADYLRPIDAAALVGVTRSYIVQLVNNGTLKDVRRWGPRSLLVSKKEVLAWSKRPKGTGRKRVGDRD